MALELNDEPTKPEPAPKAASKPEAKIMVKMNTSIAGLNWSATPGSTVAIDARDAHRLVSTGQASYVNQDDAPKAASKPAAESRQTAAKVGATEQRGGK